MPKKGTSSINENFIIMAMPKNIPAQKTFLLPGFLMNFSQKYKLKAAPSAAAVSVVTKCPWAIKVGEKAISASAPKPAQFPPSSRPHLKISQARNTSSIIIGKRDQKIISLGLLSDL